MSIRIAVVTGANRGIGLEICRQLARQGMRVILTSRDVVKGKSAARVLADEGMDIIYHQLDVTDSVSARVLAAFIEHTQGAADVLVNNAGVMLDPKGASVLDVRPAIVKRTFDSNVLGALMVSQALVPLMRRRKYGRVVNLSSGLGQLSGMGSGTPAYRISKAALNALTCTLAAEVRQDNVLVNAACPGWVRSDMGGPEAPKTLEQGADTPVWLATLPDDGPSGGYFRDRVAIPW